jgi:hypothetical protein
VAFASAARKNCIELPLKLCPIRFGFSHACALNIATGPGTQVRFDWFWLSAIGTIFESRCLTSYQNFSSAA